MKKKILLSVLSLFAFWTPLSITKQTTTNKNQLLLTGEKTKATPKEILEETQKELRKFIKVHTEIKEKLKDLIEKFNTAYDNAIIPYKEQGFVIEDVIYRVSKVNDLIKYIISKQLNFINLLRLNDFFLPDSMKAKQSVIVIFSKFKNDYLRFTSEFSLATVSNNEREWRYLEGSFFVNILFFKQEVKSIEEINNDFLECSQDRLKDFT